MLLESLKIPLGTPAPSFNLKGIDDKIHSLEDYNYAHTHIKALVIIFTCNHCPYAQAVWPRLITLYKKYTSFQETTGIDSYEKVEFIAINPNFNPAYPDDSFEKMKEYAEKLNLHFPYLQDTSQDVARVYQAQCTPDIFVYDQNRKLAYHGRVDDNWKEPEKVTRNELDEAIAALFKNEKPNEAQHPSMGCSIKYRENG